MKNVLRPGSISREEVEFLLVFGMMDFFWLKEVERKGFSVSYDPGPGIFSFFA